jgi:hypothetical protein
MRLSSWIIFAPVALLCGAAFVARAADKEAEDRQSKADITAFRAYLKSEKLDGRWQGDPQRLDGPVLRTAYPERRVYFTYASPPLPPGANIPDVIKAYQRRVEEYKTMSLRLSVLMDGEQKITPLNKTEDYNVGLMPVRNDEDARIAATAILSMCNADRAMPAVFPSSKVEVKKTDEGWTCSVKIPMGFNGTVTFDAKGKCTTVVKQVNFIQAPPPSAPPRGTGTPLPPKEDK